MTTPFPLHAAKLGAACAWYPVNADEFSTNTVSTPDSSEKPGAAVDSSVLAQLCDGDAAFERRILGNFQGVATTDAAKLKSAVANADLVEVTRVAHAIKGASATIGAGALSSLCAQIEAAGRAGEWDAIRTHMANFDRELDRVRAYIQSTSTPGE